MPAALFFLFFFLRAAAWQLHIAVLIRWGYNLNYEYIFGLGFVLSVSECVGYV